MKKFLKQTLAFLLVPLLLLSILFWITDPYKTIRPFSLEYFDITNRDYLSSELFLMNKDRVHYDSFIFGSSRGCGLNTYHWSKYLPDSCQTFLFQAWGETITGIEQKIQYIDSHNYPINNAIVLIDIPDSFKEEQLGKKALSIKDPVFSQQPRIAFQLTLFWNFIQKPSQWLKAIRSYIHPHNPVVSFDPITNDWDGENKYADLDNPPQKDSLKNLSQIAKKAFLKQTENLSDNNLSISKDLINDGFRQQLEHIRAIFLKNKTNYKIVISPTFCYLNPAISPKDLTILYSVFGERNVYDYSGENELTSDYNNFFDPDHFGQFIGWHIIEDIYN